METWEDYYELLGVGPDADERQIKEAYRCWVQILHPDRLMNAAESVRTAAQRQLVRVNRAYAVLSDAEKRWAFDSRWHRIEALHLPSVILEPQMIGVSDLLPGRPRRATFRIFDSGGPYHTLEVKPDDDLVRVCSVSPMTGGHRLPAEVTLEVTVGRNFAGDMSLVRVIQDGEYMDSVMLILEPPAFVREEMRW